MQSPDLISLVITTYNRSEALVAVLAALADQTDTGFEVVVADDGSSAAHRQVIEACATKLPFPVSHMWHPDVGFTASCARNRGVVASRGDYIVLLDGDCIPEVDFVAQHRRLRQDGCFVNGSRVMLSERLTQMVLAHGLAVHHRPWPFWLGQRLLGHASKLSHLLRWPDGERRCQVQFVWKGIRSCNMGVWRADYEKIHGFDESFVGWGHEDADFVLRLHNAGVVRKNGYCATEVYHLWHREASRQQESDNAQRVRDRMRTGQIAATQSSLGKPLGADVVVKRWR